MKNGINKVSFSEPTRSSVNRTLDFELLLQRNDEDHLTKTHPRPGRESAKWNYYFNDEFCGERTLQRPSTAAENLPSHNLGGLEAAGNIICISEYSLAKPQRWECPFDYVLLYWEQFFDGTGATLTIDVLVSIIYALSLVLLSNTLHWDRYPISHTKLDNVVLIPICCLFTYFSAKV